MTFEIGDLIRVIHPNSLKKMNIVGIIINRKYPNNNWFCIWVPDICKEICFDKSQMEKIL
ncbi:MAG: hypothetical protein CMB52_05525 [Euryarchaeota archaeon]|nr:hypothetical protein [Euryarchaeota archaeon]MBJ84957.1 hypothetical protein [Euryarchaeota archaeon]